MGGKSRRNKNPAITGLNFVIAGFILRFPLCRLQAQVYRVPAHCIEMERYHSLVREIAASFLEAGLRAVTDLQYFLMALIVAMMPVAGL